jgi:hypothetical protein
MVKFGVLFKVQTEFLNNIYTSFVFKGLKCVIWQLYYILLSPSTHELCHKTISIILMTCFDSKSVIFSPTLIMILIAPTFLKILKGLHFKFLLCGCNIELYHMEVFIYYLDSFITYSIYIWLFVTC